MMIIMIMIIIMIIIIVMIMILTMIIITMIMIANSIDNNWYIKVYSHGKFSFNVLNQV